MPDYYNILGIKKTNNIDEIKAAYKRLASIYHPDKNDGKDDKFIEINEAYQVLSDPVKKLQYDKPSKKTISFDNFKNFSRTNTKTRSTEIIDISLKLETSIVDIFNGQNNKIIFNRVVNCFNCKTGINPSCEECQGIGKKTIKETYIIDTYDTRTITLHSKGHQSKAGHFGNAIIDIVVTNNSNYTVINNILRLDIKLSFLDLLQGCDYIITHLDDKQLKLKIPAKTSNDTLFKLHNKGIMKNGIQGDLIICVSLDLNSINTELFNKIQLIEL